MLNAKCCWCGEVVKSPYSMREDGFFEVSGHKNCIGSYVNVVKAYAEEAGVDIETAKKYIDDKVLVTV